MSVYSHLFTEKRVQILIRDALRDLVPFVQFEKRENTHGAALRLAKLQSSACNSTKSNTPPWVFFIFFKLYKWYQSCKASHIIST